MESPSITQSVTQPNSKYYAIHQPIEFRGVYRAWDEVKKRIDTVTFNRNKSFTNQEDAEYWALHGVVRPIPEGESPRRPLQSAPPRTQHGSVRPTAQVETPVLPLQSLPQNQWQRPQVSTPGPATFPVKRERVDAVQQDEKRHNSTTIDVTDRNGGLKLADFEQALCTPSWYAVARGRRQGLYSDWAGPGGAQEQVDGFKGAVFKKISGRTAAVSYLCSSRVPESQIRLFARSYRAFAGSTLKITFNDEWKLYAATQTTWNPHESRKEKIDAIYAELIRHYLPGGISENQIDEHGEIVLTDDQTLTIYQGMLRAARKQPGVSIHDCLLEFKAAPYVNIIDFIDAYRQNEQVRIFAKWEEFKSYSLDPGHKIDVMYAKENELLAPLLHNLSKGPDSGNPISVRKRFEKKRALKNRPTKGKESAEQTPEPRPQPAIAVPAPEPVLGPSEMLARWTPSPPSSFASQREPTTPAFDHTVPHPEEVDKPVLDIPEIKLNTRSPTAARTPISNSPAPNPAESDVPAVDPPPIEHDIQSLAPPVSFSVSTSDYGEVIELTQDDLVEQPPPPPPQPAEKTTAPPQPSPIIPSSAPAPASPSLPILPPSSERPDELDLVQADSIPQTPPPPTEPHSSLPMRSSVRRRLLMVLIPVKQQSTPPAHTPSKLSKRGMDEVRLDGERPRKRGRPAKFREGAGWVG
ncbi:hypothetical protein P153DRAFT_363103 [Dothidotthia symphoricarpi CBS 119687]|uniref:Ribonuclease H1 N-terminal domain-containing protein n=1 Tax=Dothidotthia symphoricarpi CBS 119687 TaxID=1392245 RepID=A0A6A6AT29_9PLEO|nr:uncharacterized protein P153DRAFT_363103 [Dothidotthia symphoricarpi CBS 119687]KAF2134114.1 hypothetical protein P153DRAFT_363103 [Dothidotthia symphoricarpi CBS 119687]